MKQTAALDHISTGAALNEEDLADLSAGIWPVVGGIVMLGVMGATALWGHKRQGLINR